MPDTIPAVLVVDFDPDTHMMLDGALPEAECAIISTRSAEMALKMAERRPPAVLVVDAKLSGLSYLTERLRRLSPHIHHVLLVGVDQQIDASRPGGGSVLRKPLDVSRVRSALRSALRLSAMTAGVKRMHAVDAPDADRPTLLPRESPNAPRRDLAAPVPEPRPTPRSNAPLDQRTPLPDRKTPLPDRGSAPLDRRAPPPRTGTRK